MSRIRFASISAVFVLLFMVFATDFFANSVVSAQSVAAKPNQSQILNPNPNPNQNSPSASNSTVSQEPQTASSGTATVTSPEVMADVNGEKIMKSDLAAECLRIYGDEVLKDQIKKFLIQLECSKQKITISQQEINDEVVKMAKPFNFSSQEWFDLLQRERNISPTQYMRDIVWPILAIRKLAGNQTLVSEAEIEQEYQAKFGPAVQVRQIVLKSRQDAEKVLTEVKANPETFASVAKIKSLDPASQPFGGLLHPIRRNSMKEAKNIEDTVFALQPGEISGIVEFTHGEFIIFRCEQHLESQQVDRAKVQDQIVMKIRDEKTRIVAEQIFRSLMERAQIEVILGNPTRSAQLPGVAAIVNGQTLGKNYISDVCVEKYGQEILTDMINKRIVMQACKKYNIEITESDIEKEIREMAIKHLPLKGDGTPNVERWIALATEESGLSPSVYRTNTVWPVLALKRIARIMMPEILQVTEDDLNRSFEATFGKKVQCLAITFELKDQRRALDVWNMANRDKSRKNFEDLAEQYSMDFESRQSRGIIPPISRYSGAPTMENAAFKLLPGEMSEILQVDESLVILHCLGFEEPQVIDINDVKSDLVADIFEKRQKLAVTRCYETLYSQAAFDNYLTNESQNPSVEKAIQAAGTNPDISK
ncbi:MAG: peptidylprolyl isomerase [Thermoguttaceae bacterium]